MKKVLKSVAGSLGYEIRRKPRPMVATSDGPAPDGDLRAALSREYPHYHLGCGPILAEGFLNIDGDFGWVPQAVRADEVHRLQDRPKAPFIQYDLRLGIPAAPGSLQTVYHSHFLEHLTEDEGIAFLADCHTVLAPGGLMRLALPDFELWCRRYAEGDQKFFDWYRKAYLGDDRRKYATRAAIFAGMLYNWGHRCAYDFDSLSARLRDAGFRDIERCAWGSSRQRDFPPAVEGPEDGRAVESLVVECRKPA